MKSNVFPFGMRKNENIEIVIILLDATCIPLHKGVYKGFD